MRIFILLLLVSCGKPTKDCVSGQEKQLVCKAEVVARWHPSSPPEFDLNQCSNLYPIGGCY